MSAAVDEALVEKAAREAFWSDDINGHHKPGSRPHTWENIPEVGRENYRRLIRAVLAAALPDVRRALAEECADEIKTAELTNAAVAEIDDANRAWWHGYGYGSEDAIRIVRDTAAAHPRSP